MTMGKKSFHLLQLFCLAGNFYIIMLFSFPNFVAGHQVIAILLSAIASTLPTMSIFLWCWWFHGWKSAKSLIMLGDD
jgi:hypothetical protein